MNTLETNLLLFSRARWKRPSLFVYLQLSEFSIMHKSFSSFPSSFKPRRLQISSTPLLSRRLHQYNCARYFSFSYAASFRISKPSYDAKSAGDIAMEISPEKWTATKVRDTFLKFFEEKNHTFGILNFFSITSKSSFSTRDSQI